MSSSLLILGMAKKAGLLAIGSDAVKTAARAGKAKLVVAAKDASEGTVRRAMYYANHSGAVYADIPHTMFEIGSITGRGSPGVLAVLDVGLAASFMKGLAAIEPERYGEKAEILNTMAEKQREIKGNRRTKI